MCDMVNNVVLLTRGCDKNKQIFFMKQEVLGMFGGNGLYFLSTVCGVSVVSDLQ